MTELHALRNAYRSDKAALLAAMQSTGASTRGIRVLLRKLSSLAGNLLQTLWQRAQLPDDMALVAVGGFGRDQLFPYSDVDVLLLLPDGTAPEASSALRTKLEEAEKERDWHAERCEDAMNERDALLAELARLRKEADKFDDGIDWIQRALQAEALIEEAGRQEPVAWMNSRNGFITKDNKNPDYNLPLYLAPCTRKN